MSATPSKDSDYGVSNFTLVNKKAGVQLSIPVNPTSVKWDGQMVVQTSDTKAGYHHQFIKYRKTNGRMTLNTGAAKNRKFTMPDGTTVSTGTGPDSAYWYLHYLGTIFEAWMKKAVQDNVGPLRLTDTYAAAHGLPPIVMDILPTTFPGFGPDAGAMSYSVPITFEIVNDYVDKYDMSRMRIDIAPALNQTEDIAYVSKPGDTIPKVAMAFYGNEDMGILINQIGVNDPYINADGTITPGSNLVIPYAPVPKGYGVSSPTGEEEDLSAPIGTFLEGFGSGIGNFFTEGMSGMLSGDE